MYNFIVILILIVSVLLAIVVLIQNSKGGGLAANFSAPNQIMGVRKTTDFLEKATWTLAIALVVLSLIATISIKSFTGGNVQQQKSGLDVNKAQQAMPISTGAQQNNAQNTTTAPVSDQQ